MVVDVTRGMAVLDVDLNTGILREVGKPVGGPGVVRVSGGPAVGRRWGEVAT